MLNESAGQILSDSSLPGLGAYGQEHERLFFGRESEIETLVASMSERRIIYLMGERWAGKTSLLRAGLIPRLMDSDDFGDAKIVVVDMASAQYAISALDGVCQARSRLQLIPQVQQGVLIVDSFELAGELYSFEEQARIGELLVQILDADLFDNVIIAFRSSCYKSQKRRFPILRRAEPEAYRFVVRPLGEVGIADCIRRTLELRELVVSEVVRDRVVSDLQKSASLRRGRFKNDGVVMPLLAFALKQLVERIPRTDRTLMPKDYLSLGGLECMVSAYVENLYPEFERALSDKRVSAAMRAGYQAGQRCTTAAYPEVDGGVVSGLQALLPTAGGVSAGGSLLVRCSDNRFALLHDSLSALSLDMFGLLESGGWEASAARHLADFYFRTGKMPDVDAGALYDEAQPGSEGEIEFVRSARRYLQIKKVRGWLLIAATTFGVTLIAFLAFALEEYRITVESLLGELKGRSKVEVVDATSEILLEIDEVLQPPVGGPGSEGFGHWLREAKVRTMASILDRRQVESALELAWIARVKGDHGSGESCESAMSHYREGIRLIQDTEGEVGGTHLEEYLYLQIIECHESQGQMDAAINAASSFLHRIAKDDIVDDDGLVSRARGLMVRGKLYVAHKLDDAALLDFEESDALLARLASPQVGGRVRAVLEIAKLHVSLGRVTGAMKRYQEVLRLLDEDSAEFSGEEANRIRRECHAELASLSALEGEYSKAQEHLEAELDLSWRYLRRWDGSYRFRRTLASSYLKLGEIEMVLSRWSSASARLQQGMSLIMELRDVHMMFSEGSESDQLSLDLGRFLSALGDLSLATTGPVQALPFYERALEHQMKVLERNETRRVLEVLSESLSRLSECHADLGNLDESVRSRGREVEILARLLKYVSGDVGVQIRHDLAVANMAHILYGQGRYEEAAGLLRRSLILAGEFVADGDAMLNGGYDDLEEHLHVIKAKLAVRLGGLDLGGVRSQGD